MSKQQDPHSGLHSEQGGVAGEHPGRARNPIVKVHDLAWLVFEKPDLDRAGQFARDFGFTTALRTGDELSLRGTDAGSPCVVIRQGTRSRFVGPAFRAGDPRDVRRLAEATGRMVTRLPRPWAGWRSIWSIRAGPRCGSWPIPRSSPACRPRSRFP